MTTEKTRLSLATATYSSTVYIGMQTSNSSEVLECVAIQKFSDFNVHMFFPLSYIDLYLEDGNH